MLRIPVSRNIAGQLVFLGTGTSHGVPVIGCGCATCTSTDPRNQRTRCSVVLGLPGGNLLIDTPPDLRIQLVREKIGVAHAILYTHEHADHLFGLDDSRIFADYLGSDLPVYCSKEVEERIRASFSYAFDPAIRQGPGGGVPRLVFRRVTVDPLDLLGVTVTPVPVRHGLAATLGYRIGNVAYCTDVKEFPPESMGMLQGLDVLILSCLRRRPHSTHLNLDEALEVVTRLAPRRTLFTHMCHEIEHETDSAELPPNVAFAYDGLVVPLT